MLDKTLYRDFSKVHCFLSAFTSSVYVTGPNKAITIFLVIQTLVFTGLFTS